MPINTAAPTVNSENDDILSELRNQYGSPATDTSPEKDNDILSELRNQYGSPTTPSSSSDRGVGSDTLTDIEVGALQIPGMVTGLLDIPAGLVGADRPFSKAAEWAGEKTGIQPGKKAEELEKTGYSLERQAAEQRMAEAWDEYKKGGAGIFSTIGKTLAEPRAVAGTIAKSVPSIAAGGALGRVARLAAPSLSGAAAGGIGEGAVSAGQQMAQTAEDVDAQRAALGSLATGAGVGLTSGLAGKFASRRGISDIDIAAAGGRTAGEVAKQAAKPIYRRVPEGVLTEGLLEELPQSVIEQISQNITEGKPWDEGVAQAATMGAIAGGVMGGGMNILPSGTVAPETGMEEGGSTTETPEPTPEEPGTPEAPTLDLNLARIVDDATLAKAGERLKSWIARAESGRMRSEINQGLYDLGAAINVPDIDSYTNSGDLLAAINAQYGELTKPVEKSVGQTLVEDYAKDENAGPTARAIGVGGQGVADAIDAALAAQQGAGITEQDQPTGESVEEQPDQVQEPEVVGLDEFVPEDTLTQDETATMLSEQFMSAVSDSPSDILLSKLSRGQYSPEQEEFVQAELDRRAEEEMDAIPYDTEASAEEPWWKQYEGEAAQHDLYHDVEEQEAADAQQEQNSGEAYGRSRAQPGVREEGERTAERSEGVQPSRQADGDSQPETPETPIQKTEVENGKSEDQAAQAPTQEVKPEPVVQAEVTIAEDEAKAVDERREGEYLPASSTEEAIEKIKRIQDVVPVEKIANGDYPKVVLPEKFQGMSLALETPVGVGRIKNAETGERYKPLRANYGHIIGQEGADGDYLDFFANPEGNLEAAKNVFVVEQKNPETGEFDEFKVMLGYPNKATAKQAYLENYEPGWEQKGFTSIKPMTVNNFKKWIVKQKGKKSGATQEVAAQEQPAAFSRPATKKQDNLAEIFSTLEYADSKEAREAAIKDHPLKDKIEYIDQNFEEIFNKLVKSDKNPDGKVKRSCR